MLNLDKLKTVYKFVRFEQSPNKTCWGIYSLKDESMIGTVYFYNPWRKWVSETEEGVVIDARCHRDIADFMSQPELKNV